MTYRIEEVRALSVGTTAQEVDVRCQSFLIENNSDAATVYFREKDVDGADCTSANGFALSPGERIDAALCAGTLSLIASDDDTDVRLLIVG